MRAIISIKKVYPELRQGGIDALLTQR
jgi:hypothetical protein